MFCSHSPPFFFSLAAVKIKKPIKTKFRMPVFNWVALKPNQINGTVFNEIDDEKILEVCMKCVILSTHACITPLLLHHHISELLNHIYYDDARWCLLPSLVSAHLKVILLLLSSSIT